MIRTVEIARSLRLEARFLSPTLLPLAFLLPTACGSSPDSQFASTNSQWTTETGSTNPSSSSTEASPEDEGAAQSDSAGEQSNGPEEDSNESTPSDAADESPNTVRFDVQKGDEEGNCSFHEQGVFCKDHRDGFECDENGKEVRTFRCESPDVCSEGEGCVPCRDGQFTCQGNQVLQCDRSGEEAEWKRVERCSVFGRTVCDYEKGRCVESEPIGGVEPNGRYWLFSTFKSSEHPRLWESGDVDSFEDLIYVSKTPPEHRGVLQGAVVDVYRVRVSDSDGDGQIEPNQHPENEENPGPVEQRDLSYLETIRIDSDFPLDPSKAEIYALEDRLYYSGWDYASGTAGIVEYQFASRRTTLVAESVERSSHTIKQLGYDELNNVWYGSLGSGSNRQVLQYDNRTRSWGIAFRYPDLAGDHMDGLEVVVDPNTNEPYVYVSDMTSDFIAQYRLNPLHGWVQENLFEYNQPSGAPVEGMGFGANGHFWMTSFTTGELYEVGGGDITKYTVPID